MIVKADGTLVAREEPAARRWSTLPPKALSIQWPPTRYRTRKKAAAGEARLPRRADDVAAVAAENAPAADRPTAPRRLSAGEQVAGYRSRGCG